MISGKILFNLRQFSHIAIEALANISGNLQDFDAQDIRVATPTRSPRDESQHEMEIQNSLAETTTSEKESPAIPEDPDARKIFIQEVSGASIPNMWISFL